MPGSLLLGTDAYSDVSDVSGRSLDSKIGGKKVSFNKAVRVKQYPWKPDLDVNTSEHLTLPSNRFWFKVYKNKHETPVSYDYTAEPSTHNAWEEENMECIHDSLAPIAEVEDQDIDGSPMHTNSMVSERNGYHYSNGNAEKSYNSHCEEGHYRPFEPPVDYFDEMRLTSNTGINGVKHVWGANGSNGYSGVHTNNFNQKNGNGNGHHYGAIKETDENSESFHSNLRLNNLRLPRTSIRNDNPARRSMRLDNSENIKLRERRSRSHDDHIDEDSRFKQLRKADKSVSTEDLNFHHSPISPTNRFYKSSRDIATQCYGTLTRTKNAQTSSDLNLPTSAHTFSTVSSSERLKSFRSPRSRLDFTDDNNKNAPINQKKDYSLEKFSNIRRSQDNFTRKSNPPTQTGQNYKSYRPDETQLNGKISNGIAKLPPRTENSMADILQKQANKTINRFNSRGEFNSVPALSKDFMNNRENTNQINNVRESSTVGYLRGRQIPLSEVNTNTNRKFLTRNNIGSSQNPVPRKFDENHNTPMLPNRAVKSGVETTNGHQPRRYLSPTNNLERRSFRNSSNSAKSSYSEGNSSMIDWSLSGFQLSTKPDNGITSISDSEYTVHRRPPLLMYIPGVSHHDRPAVEDDRLSALSDLTRSEINDSSSSLTNANITKDRNGIGDFKRRQSMREGKLKWMKWRNKS